MQDSKPVGRPTKYQDTYPAQALKLCKLGATDKELANFFEVHIDTIDEWKRAHPEFSDALKEGKLVADAEVASKLFHRATGYSHKAVKIVADAKTKEEHIVEYVEHYPPDTTAAIFWLKNRRPDLWRDKVDHSLTGDKENPIQTVTRIELVPMRGNNPT